MIRFLPALCLFGFFSPCAYADSYEIPPDYHVTCLDARTGQPLWDAHPPKMARPELSVQGDWVIAKSQIALVDGQEPKKVVYWIDRKTGGMSTTGGPSGGKQEQVIPPLQKLSRNLTANDGRKFEYSRGNTRHLTTIVDGQEKIVKRLDDYIYDLNLVGDLAIFTYSGGSVRNAYLGEVYAWDLNAQKFAWTFRPKRHIPNLAKSVYTGIAVDRGRILVSTDQVLFALDAKSGKVEWTTRLPRQKIRRYDSPWIQVGRVGDTLYVSCYEDLFALRAKDGQLIWSFDCGDFGVPWPTIVDHEIYVGTRNLTSLKVEKSD